MLLQEEKWSVDLKSFVHIEMKVDLGKIVNCSLVNCRLRSRYMGHMSVFEVSQRKLLALSREAAPKVNIFFEHQIYQEYHACSSSMSIIWILKVRIFELPRGWELKVFNGYCRRRCPTWHFSINERFEFFSKIKEWKRVPTRSLNVSLLS